MGRPSQGAGGGKVDKLFGNGFSPVERKRVDLRETRTYLDFWVGKKF